MKEFFIVLLIVILSITGYAQDDIKLVPYNNSEIERITELKNCSDNDKIRDLVYSKNKQNAVSIEVNPADTGKAQKIQLNIIKLYDKEGNLLAKSKPIDLCDWIVKPMGDNKTVLVIFPAGTARQAIITVYKKSGKTLKEVKTIERETSFFTIDISMGGKYFVCGFSVFNGISDKPEIKLFNDYGEMLWSSFIDESRFYQVAISRKLVFGASKDSENKKGFMYLFDYKGKRLMKEEIDSHIGNYKIELSDFTNDKYFAISSLKNIYLFDSDKKGKVKDFTSENGMEISDYVIDKDGTIVFTVMNKEYSKEKRQFDISDQELIIEDIQNHKKSIRLESDKKPLLYKVQSKIILKISNNKKDSYYEIQY